MCFASRPDRSPAIALAPLVAEQLGERKSSAIEDSNATLATLKVGTNAECDVRVKNDETDSKLFGLISRRHCRLEVRPGALVLLDGVRCVWERR